MNLFDNNGSLNMENRLVDTVRGRSGGEGD